MVVNTRAQMTVREFDTWVQQAAPDQRYEFIAGEVVEVVSRSSASSIAARINGFLFMYLVQHDIGYLTGADGGYQIAGERYIPDVALMLYTTQSAPTDDAYNATPPDLAVEVISNPQNNQEMRDLRVKIGGYATVGTTLWVVDPQEKTVEIYVPGKLPEVVHEDGVIAGGDLLPGFKLAVKDIFATGQTQDNP